MPWYEEGGSRLRERNGLLFLTPDARLARSELERLRVSLGPEVDGGVGCVGNDSSPSSGCTKIAGVFVDAVPYIVPSGDLVGGVLDIFELVELLRV